MKTVLFLLSLLTACSNSPSFPHLSSRYNGNGRKLVIVAPTAWQADLTGYIQAKRDEGFKVVTMNAEAEVHNLGPDLDAAAPDFVFLVGDEYLIPTVYQCNDITWSTAFGRSCTYSDYWYGSGRYVVGRLMTHNESDVITYVLKAAAYRARTASKRVYLINDRAYDATDYYQVLGVNTLKANGITSNLDAVNFNLAPFNQDGAGEASPDTINASVDNGDDLISYFGHGSADVWGYNLNVYRLGIQPAVGSVIPLVFAMACETARNAPNAPWYVYMDVDGNVVNLGSVGNFIPGAEIPDPARTQPIELLNDSMGARFTSDLPSGSMVYLGETVVTGAESALTTAFYKNWPSIYDKPTTIGDFWNKVVVAGHPEYWQFVGDPSTWFIQ
jgi:hypothetical protein